MLSVRCGWAHGFTLIELIVVLLLIGVMVLVATPMFVGVTREAQQSALDSTALTLESASVRNYALRIENPSTGLAISNCNQVSTLVPAWSAKYSAYTISDQAIAVGGQEVCTLNGPDTTFAAFVGHGT